MHINKPGSAEEKTDKNNDKQSSGSMLPEHIRLAK